MTAAPTPRHHQRVCLRHPEGGTSWVVRDEKGRLCSTMYPTHALPADQLEAVRQEAPHRVFDLEWAYLP